MSLNIKNEHVHDLARRAAKVSGLSQTAAIEEALTDMLVKYDDDPVAAERERRAARIKEMARRARARWDATPPDQRVAVDDLYDPDTGLPW